jgi:prepilin-type N-terminal cleavage/methylation domain-containing protein
MKKSYSPSKEKAAMHTILERRRGARDQRGFTLVELLVVVLILGVLAAVVVFSVGGISTRGKNASCLTEVREVRTAIEAYKAQSATNVYPPTFATLWTAPTQLLESPITATSPSAVAGYVYGGPATGTYNVAAGKPGCPAG